MLHANRTISNAASTLARYGSGVMAIKTTWVNPTDNKNKSVKNKEITDSQPIIQLTSSFLKFF